MNKKKRTKLKDIEIRVISELMMNSRRSDREIAKSVGTSQPTVSRIVKKLEKEGVIKEYTIIPDFKKLGFEIMGISFFRKGEPPKDTERTELRKTVAELEEKNPFANLMAVNGMGFGKSQMFITLYRDYTRYIEAMRLAPSLPRIDTEGIESFLVDLNESSYRLLSLRQVARNIQAYEKVSKEELKRH